MNILPHDLRYALRTLGRSPAFTLAATMTLAVGIATCSVVFGTAYGALLRPLPYAQAERLVSIDASYPPLDTWFRSHTSYPNYVDFRSECDSLEDLAAYRIEHLHYTSDPQPTRLTAIMTTANLFNMMGIKPLLGRFFNEDEDRPGADPVVLLGERFWRAQLGGADDVIGRSITLGEGSYTVIGVIPERFDQGWFDADVWLALTPQIDVNERYVNRICLIGRCRAGADAATVAAGLNTVEERLEQSYPTEVPEALLRAVPLREARLGADRVTAITALSVGVAFVLLIACCNVANLMLTRAAGRSDEFAIRAALGATPRRLTRQLLVESALLAAAAGSLGILLALWGVPLVSWLLSPDNEVDWQVRLEPAVLLITVVLSVMTVLLFGLVPAGSAARTSALEALRSAGRAAGLGTRRRWVRESFAVAQIALSVVLLVGAGLLIRSLIRLENARLGFDPEGVLTAQINLPEYAYADRHQRRAFYDGVLESLQRNPACAAVAVADGPPLVSSTWTFCQPEGYAVEEAENEPYSGRMIVSPGYWETMRIPILTGRGLQDTDNADAPSVAVVNQAFARHFWPGEDPLGKRLRFTMASPWCTVVGVAANTLQGPRASVRPEVYVPNDQFPQLDTVILVRAARGTPAALADTVRRAVWSVDASQPVHNIQPLTGLLGRILFRWRAYAGLLSAFAAIALLLAVVGVYAVVSFAVAQRTREIGVRVAVGASRGQIMSMILRRSAALAVAGIAIGLITSLAATRLLSGLLFETVPTDLVTYCIVSLALGSAAMGASYLPARRAVRLDPMIALRCE